MKEIGRKLEKEEIVKEIGRKLEKQGGCVDCR